MYGITSPIPTETKHQQKGIGPVPVLIEVLKYPLQEPYVDDRPLATITTVLCSAKSSCRVVVGCRYFDWGGSHPCPP
jgi:hypothetical protein